MLFDHLTGGGIHRVRRTHLRTRSLDGARARADELLGSLRAWLYAEKKLIAEYSKGMRKRVAYGRRADPSPLNSF